MEQEQVQEAEPEQVAEQERVAGVEAAADVEPALARRLGAGQGAAGEQGQELGAEPE